MLQMEQEICDICMNNTVAVNSLMEIMHVVETSLRAFKNAVREKNHLLVMIRDEENYLYKIFIFVSIEIRKKLALTLLNCDHVIVMLR